MAHQISDLFNALSDPTRCTVIEDLCAGPASVSQLYNKHDMALPSFMKHLRKLEEAGLVHSHKTGRTRFFRLNPAALATADAWLTQQRATIARQSGGLDALLMCMANGNRSWRASETANDRISGT
ncbi:MAG: metalloregulator ArsR/SmtB family transcription factor [Paracoccaceae bacterium]|nr:metalloregulator ArsR/SmtB family transcription factor [Paracoccaceae bacterium]